MRIEARQRNFSDYDPDNGNPECGPADEKISNALTCWTREGHDVKVVAVASLDRLQVQHMLNVGLYKIWLE
jgi:hypothetical protein